MTETNYFSSCLTCEHSSTARDGKVECSKHPLRLTKDTALNRCCWDFKRDETSMLEPKTDIVSQIGLPATLEQLAEECCELGHAALKLARKLRNENPTPKTEHECKKNLTEEIADVMVCLNILEENKVIDMYDVENMAANKDNRWFEWLKEVKQ